MKKQILISLILLSSISIKLLAQTPVNFSSTTDYNTLYTGQQGASLISGHYQSANAPEGGTTCNYFSVWHQNFLDPNVASSIAIGTDNNLYARLYWYGTWTNWNKFWHSGNLNRTDVDFTARNITLHDGLTDLGNTNLRTSILNFMSSNGSNSWESGFIAGIVGNPGDIKGYPGGLSFYTKAKDGSYSSTSTERMRICYNGNVGIGTTCPAYTLDVKGTIRAREVKVDLLGGCDFVFKSDYKLMDLKTLEQFVKTNQHLPEIAPEKEMVENGVNMKEMQMKLLQKIEELTLYTIEQNKEIIELKKQNERFKALEEKVEKLESASK